MADCFGVPRNLVDRDITAPSFIIENLAFYLNTFYVGEWRNCIVATFILYDSSKLFQQQKMAETREHPKTEKHENITTVRELLEKKDYRTELYSNVLQVILNNSRAQDFGDVEMLQFVKRLFNMSENEHSGLLAKARQHGASEHCIVRVLFQRAEGLAPKDKKGLSDPYCLAAVTRYDHFADFSKLEVRTSSTTCKKRTLNPDWNETKDLFLFRNQVDDCYLQVQVWDSDTDLLESSLKAKHLTSLGKWVKHWIFWIKLKLATTYLGLGPKIEDALIRT